MILNKTNKKIKMLFPINSKINNKFQEIKNNNYKSKSIKETHIIKTRILDIVNIKLKNYYTYILKIKTIILYDNYFLRIQ